jgi:DNA-binding response OmpR family regulator
LGRIQVGPALSRILLRWPCRMGARRLVVVVEDSPTLRHAVERDLMSDGFEVKAASDYHVAVRLLDERPPDVVCCDLVLPRESGLELVEHIRRAPQPLRTVPILVMSARGSPEDMAHAEEAGANAYLKKPFSRERLLKYVRALLDGPASSPGFRALRPLVRA